MVGFLKRLHAPIMRGEVTCSIRIWQRPQVKVGGRYHVGDGHIEVLSFRRIDFADLTPELARESGFAGLVDLLKTARHGPGEILYLFTFRYLGQAD